MKQELVEFRAFRDNLQRQLMLKVSSAFRSRSSAPFRKSIIRRERQRQNNYGKRVDGIECSPLLRTRGRSAEEGRVCRAGGEGVSAPEREVGGCLQVKNPASAPALSSATCSNEAVLFGTSQTLPSRKLSLLF